MEGVSLSFSALQLLLDFKINIDWFQPFKHSTYPIGAIYVAIANLLRTERYTSDNVLLIGIILGPKEPKLDINTYLQPLVDELKEL